MEGRVTEVVVLFASFSIGVLVVVRGMCWMEGKTEVAVEEKRRMDR